MKGNEEDVYHSGRGQSLRPHNGGREWIKGGGMWRENSGR